MTTAAEPRQELVLLEPRDRGMLDLERAALLAEIERELPTDEIVSPLEYTAIADLERRLGIFIKNTEPMFDEHCSAARKVWTQACDIRALFIDGPKTLKAQLRTLLGRYEDEDRDRRDRERRLAIEEQQREEARLKQEAKLAEKQGQPELAKAIRATPVQAPAIVLPSAVPDVGLTYQERWTWEVVGGDTAHNRAKALAMIVRPEFLGLVKWDDAGLTAHAVRTRGTVPVPGIRFFPKQVPVRR